MRGGSPCTPSPLKDAMLGLCDRRTAYWEHYDRRPTHREQYDRRPTHWRTVLENTMVGERLSGNGMIGERLSGNTMMGERLPPYGPLSIISQNASVLDEAGESVERLWLFFTFLPMASIICCQVTWFNYSTNTPKDAFSFRWFYSKQFLGTTGCQTWLFMHFSTRSKALSSTSLLTFYRFLIQASAYKWLPTLSSTFRYSFMKRKRLWKGKQEDCSQIEYVWHALRGYFWMVYVPENCLPFRYIDL